MSGIATWGRRAGRVGTGLGVVAVGAAIGLAAERYAVGRSFRADDPEAAEPLGQLHGRPLTVLTDDGIGLHVEIDTDEDLPDPAPVTVLFCHGFALTQETWHYQRRDLGDVGRLVFYDQRGHGRSGWGDREHANIDQLGRDLHRVLDAAAPTGPVVLVGHSMGGMTIMALADQAPELFGDRIVGVALLSTSPGKLAEVGFGAPAAIARRVRGTALRALEAARKRPMLVERGRSVTTDLTYVLTKRYSFATDVPPSLVEFTARMNRSTPIDVLADLFPAFDSHDKLCALDVLNGLESLILVGEQDLLTPADHSRDMVDAVPGAELVVLPQAGHMVMLEHYDVVNDHLRDLVERAVRAAAAA